MSRKKYDRHSGEEESDDPRRDDIALVVPVVQDARRPDPHHQHGGDRSDTHDRDGRKAGPPTVSESTFYAYVYACV